MVISTRGPDFHELFNFPVLKQSELSGLCLFLFHDIEISSDRALACTNSDASSSRHAGHMLQLLQAPPLVHTRMVDSVELNMNLGTPQEQTFMWLQTGLDKIDDVAEAKIIDTTSMEKGWLFNDLLVNSEERKHYKMSVILEHLDMKPTPFTQEYFRLTEANFIYLQMIAGRVDEAFAIELTSICPHILFWLSDRHKQAQSAADWQKVGPEIGVCDMST